VVLEATVSGNTVSNAVGQHSAAMQTRVVGSQHEGGSSSADIAVLTQMTGAACGAMQQPEVFLSQNGGCVWRVP
jgi:hypothetical protein